MKRLFKLHSTEERISIRESLRIFKKIEIYINNKSGINNNPNNNDNNNNTPTFLKLVHNAAKTLGINNVKFYYKDNEFSCGNTVNSFLSLFLSKSQLSNRMFDNISNGLPIITMINNPVIIFYSIFSLLHYHFPIHMKRKSNNYDNVSNNILSISNYVAQNGLNNLKNILLTNDSSNLLPKVLICSIVFINEDITMKTGNPDAIFDHKFIIIKHDNGNEDYQIVQGYQNYYQCNINKINIHTFLKSMQTFCSDNKFDSKNYQSMFHVDLQKVLNSKTNIWRSISYQELHDSSIKGSGGREIVNEIERIIDSKKYLVNS